MPHMHAHRTPPTGADLRQCAKALGEVLRVWGGEVEEGFVTGADEGIGFALRVGGGEGGGECVAEGCGGDEEVAGVVGAREAVGVGWRVAGRWWWGSKVGGVFAVGPEGWVVLVMGGW